MGGAYGHLMHLHEDRDLTFNDLERIFRKAEAGRLDLCTEKTDGMNLVFTWDEAIHSAQVARSAGDIKRGGMDAAALSARFADRSPWVKDTFESAFSVLSSALWCLGPEDRARIFEGGTRWYSLEVIDSDCTNVIRYDLHRSNIVFHAHGSFSVAPSGVVIAHTEAPGVQVLSDRLGGCMINGWFFHGPQRATVRCPDDGPGDEANVELGMLLSTTWLRAENTIGDFLLATARRVAVTHRLDDAVTEMIALRMSGHPEAPSLTQIKARMPPAAYSFVKASVELEERELVRPLERIVHRFSVGLLHGFRSMMVKDHEAEVQRVRLETDRAIETIYSRGNEKAKLLLDAQLSRLVNTRGITSSAEGIVFRYGGRAYKLTGNFAPVNQILGLVRYGRGEAQVAKEARCETR